MLDGALRVLVLGGAAILITLSLFSMPSALEQMGLDWSYQAALGYYLAHGFQYGRDVLYTYGPLGILRLHVTAGYYLDLIFFGGLALSAALATVLVGLTWQGRSLLLVIFLAAQVAFFNNYQWDAPFLAGIVAVSLLWTLPRVRTPFVVAATLLLSVAALIKFTYFSLAIACLVITSAHLLLVGRRRDAALFPGTFALGLAALWFVALHHNAGSFLQWVRGSAEIAAGFNDTMGGIPDQRALIFGVAVLAAMAVLIIVQGIAARHPIVGLTRSLLLGAGLFVAWKQGFVRPDEGHMLALPVTALTLATAAMALMLAEARDRRQRLRMIGILSFVAAAVSCSALLMQISRNSAFAKIWSPAQVLTSLTSKVRLLFIYPEYKQFVRTNLAKAETKFALPELTRQIGSATVDVYGNEIGIAILNRWNYRPRPVIQSFSAYTRYLADRNARFINGPAAPEFYVMRVNIIDNRLPLSADGPAFAAILDRYELIGSEGGYYLMRKRAEYRRRVVLSGEAKLGEEIPLPPAVGQELRYLRVTIDQTFFGRVRSFLLSPAHLRLSVRYVYGATHSFRLLREPAADGVLLDTMTGTENGQDGSVRGNVPALLDGCAPPPASIRLEVTPDGAGDFKATFRYAVETQPRRAAKPCS